MSHPVMGARTRRPSFKQLVSAYGEQKAADIIAERKAVARLDRALSIIEADLAWFWHWGDGRGGVVLNMLAERVQRAGYEWPYDQAGSLRAYGSQKTKKKISATLRRRVFERDKYRCIVCEAHIDLCCDHIIPESKGGETVFDNLQTLCRPCNSRKGVQ